MAASSHVPGPSQVATAELISLGQSVSGPSGSTVIRPALDAVSVSSGLWYQTRILNTTNSISSVFGAGSTPNIDFFVCGSRVSTDISVYTQLDLEFTVANGSGIAALTVMPSAYSISRIEFLIAGAVVSTISAPMISEHMMFSVMPQYEFDANFLTYGYATNPPTAVGTTIAAASSATFRLPLLHLFPFIKKMVLGGISSDLQFRFWMNPASQYLFSTSVSTSISCTEMRIIAAGTVMAGESGNMLTNISRSSRTFIDAVFPQFKTSNIGALSAGSTSGRQTLNISGQMIVVWCDVYNDTPANPEDYLATVGFSQAQFFNSVGGLMSIGTVTPDEYYVISADLYSPSNVVLPLTISPAGSISGTTNRVDRGPSMVLCKHISDVIACRRRHGSYQFQLTESFSIQAPAGGYTNALVNFYFLQTGQIIIDGKTGVVSYRVDT